MRLSFTPPDERTHSTVLLVRNNLTVLDAALIQGRGGRGFLKFGNRKPGSSLPLAFNIGAKHLKDCDSKCCNSCRRWSRLSVSLVPGIPQGLPLRECLWQKLLHLFMLWHLFLAHSGSSILNINIGGRSNSVCVCAEWALYFVLQVGGAAVTTSPTSR